MAVQKIIGKQIIKRNENFKPIVNTNNYGIEPDYSMSKLNLYDEQHVENKKNLEENIKSENLKYQSDIQEKNMDVTK